MITEHDLQEAIAECEGQRNPNANTCMKLAAFYTIKQHMFGGEKEQNTYSFASGPEPEKTTVDYTGDSEFSQAVSGRDEWGMWSIMDELMDTLKVVNPRLYAGVMRRVME